ncbi:MAG: hypothetical protein CL927_05960 [Deltaproteobacteria bacterium]|nr:hypothetical protein [Deltaproteobacteria bacterium]HCH65815.1 hypothetical protein [Deltaproteobacteria bacterium]
MPGSPAQPSAPVASASVEVYDDRPLPRVCAVCGAPATTTAAQSFALREPTYRLMLYTGIGMGLFIATWMMVKVRPNITQELPAAVSFTLLFMASFLPVWIVASLTSRHAGTLQIPLCNDHADGGAASVTLASEGDGKLTLSGVSAGFAAAAQPVEAD